MTPKMWLATGSMVAVFMFVGAAQAQRPEGRDPKQMLDRQVTAMKERLKLTDDQVAKVKPILADSMKSMMEMREKYGPPQPGEGPSEEMMAAMRKNREDTNKKLSEVLSKDQMTEYEKMMSERRRGPGRPGGPEGGRRQQQ